MATKKQPKTEEDMMTQDKRKTRLIGVVVSDKMAKTVVVKIERTMRHPLYKKTMTTEKKYKAHDELGAVVGDRVLIEETRPMSKDKRFIVKKIFEKTLVIAPELTEETDLDLLLGIEKKDEKTKAEEPTGETA